MRSREWDDKNEVQKERKKEIERKKQMYLDSFYFFYDIQTFFYMGVIKFIWSRLTVAKLEQMYY